MMWNPFKKQKNNKVEKVETTLQQADHQEELDAALAQAHADMDAAKFDDVIRYYEGALARIEPRTPLYAIIGRSFMGQLDEAVQWLIAAYDAAAQESDVTVVYVEMCRFEINTHAWILNAFAFNSPEQEAFEDLSCYSYASDDFRLAGVEDVQAAMEKTKENGEDDLNTCKVTAFGLTWELVLVHMFKLMAAAYKSIQATGHPLGNIPFFAAVHDDMMIYDAEKGTVECLDSPGVLDYRLTDEEDD